MTKREKIAITVFALIGFAWTCFTVITLAPLIKFLFIDKTCYIDVEYEKTPFAMGENYVYIAPTFFDEQDLEVDGRVSIMYRGTKNQYKDGNFDSPIKTSWEYSLSLKEKYDSEYYKKIDISCRNPRNYSETKYRYSYGNLKYARSAYSIKYTDGGNSEEYESCYQYEYEIFARAESGKACVMKVTIIVAEAYEDDLSDKDLSETMPQKLFESMLDNIVSYSHFL